MGLAKMGVLFVHGMGRQSRGYSAKTVEALRSELKDLKVVPSFAAAEVYWSDLLDSRQDKLLNEMRAHNDVDWITLRRSIVLGGFGDVMAYLGSPTRPSQYYTPIHRRVAAALYQLKVQVKTTDRRPAPLMIIAHSLGCAIATDYLWDAARGEWGVCPFTKGESLVAMTTFGCNLPLFTLTLKEKDIQATAVPGRLARVAFKDQAGFLKHSGWYNYYDPDDLLGFPLKQVSPSFDSAVRADVAVNSGVVWNAHQSYWTDSEVVKPIARQIASLLRCM